MTEPGGVLAKSFNIAVTVDERGVHFMREDGEPMGKEFADSLYNKLFPYLASIPEYTAKP